MCLIFTEFLDSVNALHIAHPLRASHASSLIIPTALRVEIFLFTVPSLQRRTQRLHERSLIEKPNSELVRPQSWVAVFWSPL